MFLYGLCCEERWVNDVFLYGLCCEERWVNDVIMGCVVKSGGLMMCFSMGVL